LTFHAAIVGALNLGLQLSDLCLPLFEEQTGAMPFVSDLTTTAQICTCSFQVTLGLLEVQLCEYDLWIVIDGLYKFRQINT
jgi:hypothetical protein